MKDPFIVLGVAREANADAIKAAYHELLKKYHPDKTGNDPAAVAKFLEIRAAWDILGSDANQRYRKRRSAPANEASAYRFNAEASSSASEETSASRPDVTAEAHGSADNNESLRDRLRSAGLTLLILVLGGAVALVGLLFFG